MKKWIQILTVVGLIFFIFSSCQTFEEGPDFTLATKKSRLLGKWKLIEVNNYPISNNEVWIFERNGVHNKEYNDQATTNPATWQFGEEDLFEIYYINDNVTFEFKILLLSSDELILFDITHADRFEFEKQ